MELQLDPPGFATGRYRLLLVTSDLAELSVAQGQRGSVVVDHQAIHFVTGTLIADIVTPQLTELVQLVLGHFDRVLKHDPDDRLGTRGRRQRSQVGPIGGGFGQKAGWIGGSGNRHSISFVRHKLEEIRDFFQLGMVFASLEILRRSLRIDIGLQWV